jgi:hypothetical protein
MRLSCGVSGAWIDNPDRAQALAVARRFDYWVAYSRSGADVTPADCAKLTALSAYCKAEQRQVRGPHLFKVHPKKPWGWHVEQAEKLAAALPNAGGWDVIHEFWLYRKRLGTPPEEWIQQAFDVASQINPGGRFYASEYRPQDKRRRDWFVEMCLWCLDQRLPLAGISLQLHSDLVSFQPFHLGEIAASLQPLINRGLEIQCFEVGCHLRTPPKFPMPPFPEQIQAQRYQDYQRFAQNVGASVFGPWDIWDGVGRFHDTGELKLAGLWRANWEEKPAYKVFFDAQ